jgi:hypothetical protein
MEGRTATRIVGTLPATGWYAEMVDGSTWPIVGFAITDNGDGFGLVVSGNALLPAHELGYSPDDFVGYVRK